MGNRPDDPVTNSDTGGFGDTLSKRAWMVILASALGMGGSWQLVKNDPFGSVDRFTGEQGKEHDARIRVLERLQALDDQHREISRELYARVRAVEQSVQTCRARVENLERYLDRPRRERFRDNDQTP